MAASTFLFAPLTAVIAPFNKGNHNTQQGGLQHLVALVTNQKDYEYYCICYYGN